MCGFAYSSFAVLIFKTLNISTINTGNNTNPKISNAFPIGKCGMLKIFLNAGISNIITTNNADAPTANNSLPLLNTFDLNNDFLLSLTLNTCTSSKNDNVTNAIV